MDHRGLHVGWHLDGVLGVLGVLGVMSPSRSAHPCEEMAPCEDVLAAPGKALFSQLFPSPASQTPPGTSRRGCAGTVEKFPRGCRENLPTGSRNSDAEQGAGSGGLWGKALVTPASPAGFHRYELFSQNSTPFTQLGVQGREQLGRQGWRVGMRFQGNPRAPGLDLSSAPESEPGASPWQPWSHIPGPHPRVVPDV